MSQIKKQQFFMHLTGCCQIKSKSNTILFHQNIRGLTNKLDEISITTQRNCIGPQLFCFIEHHLKKFEIDKLFLEDYILASSFCRETSLGGGVCILTNRRLKYKAIVLAPFVMKKPLKYVQ